MIKLKTPMLYSHEGALRCVDDYLAQIAVDRDPQYDYCLSDINRVDALIADLDDDAPKSLFKTHRLRTIGCLYGEIFIRRHGGRWRTAADVGMPELIQDSHVVELPNGLIIHPLHMVKRKLHCRATCLNTFFRKVVATLPPVGKPLYRSKFLSTIAERAGTYRLASSADAPSPPRESPPTPLADAGPGGVS